ncbi:DUF5694 domain-containing protein [Zeaxanthinibacter sp. PT1]|uniref:DUF5694 domain-containing protein n=1 Tax=Zeaxanthinibacter TaxID=561554 RepID=UPI00234A90E2|nr:DUF5694 domain-containing protein [Zeaxanthinibacter sp. PT1]MDC6351049.1 DUF5694 domain-containing protein [Zeaxanthinibacter sp. PT1]
MNKLLLSGLLALLISCQQPTEKKEVTVEAPAREGIPVLNLGTFHMGYTSDANTTEFDEHDQKKKEEVHRIAAKLAEFRPTVILVEMEPEYNNRLQQQYRAYLENPEMHFEHPDEIELLAYEVGRLSGVEKIFGIDHQMGYNYPGIDSLANALGTAAYKTYMDNAGYRGEQDYDSASTLDKLRIINRDINLDFLITVNADILTHVATEGNFEGADEAAKFYHRNLRMFSNINQLPLAADDRVFMLMGAAHTAFFRDFMSRNPRYHMVDTYGYLD